MTETLRVRKGVLEKVGREFCHCLKYWIKLSLLAFYKDKTKEMYLLCSSLRTIETSHALEKDRAREKAKR